MSTAAHRRRVSARKVLLSATVILAGFTLLAGFGLVAFGGSILNGYVKQKAQRTFAAQYPGCELRIGRLDYSPGVNRLVAQSVSIRSPKASFQAGPISLRGIRWFDFLTGKPRFAEALREASVDATALRWQLPKSLYSVGCARVRASVPGSEIQVEGIELHALAEEEEYFSRSPYRSTRFFVRVPELTASGVAFPELLEGKGYRAAALRISEPSLDAFVNREKPPRPAAIKKRLMVHEGLAALTKPFAIDDLRVRNGQIVYRERVQSEADPGALTFGSVNIISSGISNLGGPTSTIHLNAVGEFMGAGLLKVSMAIPTAPTNLALRYSGSLGEMDLTRLNAFLDPAEHTRVKSGRANAVAFEIDVSEGWARGRVRADYENLTIATLDKGTGDERNVASFMANVFKVRNGNAPTSSGSKEGQVNYTRNPQDNFLKFIWAALRTGVLDVISH